MTERTKTNEASRRDLLKIGAWAAAASLLPVSSVLGYRIPPGSDVDSALLYRSTFRSQLNEPFWIRQLSGREWMRTISLRLIDVRDVPTAEAGGTADREDCFTALFSGPLKTPLAQKTYEVRNGSLGRFQLFLVPGGVSDSGRLYTATFNRALPS